jgi:hypothetical protein
LDTDAMWKIVSSELGILYSRFAIPYPLEKIRESFLTIPTAQPGLFGLFHWSKSVLIFVTMESGNACADKLFAIVKAATNKKMDRMRWRIQFVLFRFNASMNIKFFGIRVILQKTIQGLQTRLTISAGANILLH